MSANIRCWWTCRRRNGAKFLRAHWEVNRWGRGPVTPSFEIGLRVREIPAELLQEARAEAAARR